MSIAVAKQTYKYKPVWRKTWNIGTVCDNKLLFLLVLRYQYELQTRAEERESGLFTCLLCTFGYRETPNLEADMYLEYSEASVLTL
jgi:hypothetical protein